ncbi:ABC transporter substrate-binding protein [Hyphococcus luteus]|uniref:Iron ABC transporter substrate-binding protein n=1 Tax=Hyphococcus luteus TaxID=2058213 RepID=A0A2S7K806_9PROT|nr:ABC transporter substrate-binding protein [Marinicaulis flavus]PQA88598.1 iron ABC transporter substrate-binding protein [Marinicaulis flavus]
MIRLTVLLLALAAAFPAAAKPRAVSLDYCTDQYLLKLADKDQVLAVSRGADKDYSHLRAEAVNRKQIRPSREEVFALAPDLVLRQWGGGANAEKNFTAFGARVVSLGYPEDFEGVKDNIRLVADALGQEPRGEALIGEMEARLDALARTSDSKKRALYVTPGGVTAGAHTMIDAMIRAAGLVNVAAEEGESYWPALPAEEVLLAPPDFIVGGFFVSRDEDINHWSAARHPALKRLLEKTPSVQLPADLVSCAAWFSVDAAEMIAKGAE